MAAFSRLLVIVPTRNRSELAAAAARSVLDAALTEVEVLVSDNSTDRQETERLAARCAALGIARIRPYEPLAMDEHWDWAIHKGMTDPSFSHVAILTDRMVYLPGALSDVVELLRRYPDYSMSYNHDGLADESEPVQLWQVPWTGRVLTVGSASLLGMMARSMHETTESVLPRLLNCVVPRIDLEAVERKYDTICGRAQSPDYAFAFRLLTVVKQIHFYDRPVLLAYAADRSNGTSAMLGTTSPDHADFLANIGSEHLNSAAPIPGLGGSINSILHEYCLVDAEAGSLPSIDPYRFVEALRDEASRKQDRDVRTAFVAAIDEYESALPRVARTKRSSRTRDRIIRALRNPRLVLDRVNGHRRPDTSYQVTTWPDRPAAIRAAMETQRNPNVGAAALELAAGREFPNGPVKKLAVLHWRGPA